MASPIGGQFISSFGGAIGFRPYENILPAPGSFTVQPASLLDVTRWELVREEIKDDTTHTGSWGAEGTDITAMRFRAAAELIWDVYNPPNFLAQNGSLLQLLADSRAVKNRGYKLWLYVGAGVNYPVSVGPYYYFAPSVKASVVTTLINAGEKKMVRARVDLAGNSPIFAMGGTLTEQALMDQYIAHCVTRSWTW